MNNNPLANKLCPVLNIHPHPESLVHPFPSPPPPPPPPLEFELEMEEELTTQFHFPPIPLMLLPNPTPDLDVDAGCAEEVLVGLEEIGVGVVKVGVSSLDGEVGGERGGGISSSAANVISRIGIGNCERYVNQIREVKSR
jgi:hypothetical protein